MVVLALVLIVIAAIATLGVLMAGPESVTLEVFGTSIDTNTVAIFLAGVVAGALFLVALGMIKAGARRSHQRRQEIRALREGQTESVRELEEEKEQLAKEKEELAARLERTEDDVTPPPPPPPPQPRPTPQP